MSRQYQRIRVPRHYNVEGATRIFMSALDNINPNDALVYHRGPLGSALPNAVFAASELEQSGAVMLTQRPDKPALCDGPRVWEYLAIKRRTANGH